MNLNVASLATLKSYATLCFVVLETKPMVLYES
jgi:hypothetical protein